ncbi:methyltransferase [Amycolatopsis nigrescens]|uniref:methyltransferase n=1 Tax=Amycolatopsis nigrescens TaxID=381445 RepID=UPI0003698885|nr:methyltransferase [Amycolatopsis nigrescens]
MITAAQEELYERLPHTLSAEEIRAVNSAGSTIHTHRRYEYNGWRFELAPGVFSPGGTSRILHDHLLNGTVDLQGKSYVAMGVGLGVEALIAGVRGAREIYAVDVHEDSVLAASKYYRELIGTSSPARFVPLVSDLFEGFPPSAKADVVTFNPPAVNLNLSSDPDVVRNLCAGTEIAKRFFDQVREVLNPGGEIFLITSNTAELRQIVRYGMESGFGVEIVYVKKWPDDEVRTHLFRFSRLE